MQAAARLLARQRTYARPAALNACAARLAPAARRGGCVAARASAPAPGGEPDDDQPVPPGCSRYVVELKKPLGIVLEQDKATGVITVADVAPDGSAARTGLVAIGDQLIATSGITYGSEEDYGGVTVKKGQRVVRVSTRGASFKTVSAAIGSHPGHMEVKLEFQRCGAAPVTASS
ncbi:Mpp7 [Scenedesmus sp. PABB004]|nr:Mpp7 [Scenedesmus sp. PABB004]